MPTQLHPGTGIGQVRLKVSDLKRSIAFYEDIVGLRLLWEEGAHAALTADGVHPLLLLDGRPGAPVTPRRTAAGLYHVAYLVPDRRSLGLVFRRLRETGIHIGHSDHWVSEALYIADPDQNGIEIYADRPRGQWTTDSQGNYRMAVDPIDQEGLLAEAEGHPWQGLPAGTRIGHIHLHVSDLARSRAFYVDTLGFAVTGKMEESALFVSAGGYHHHIGMNIWAGAGARPAPAEATGLVYFTVEIPGESERQAAVDRLRAAGYAVAEADDGAWRVCDPSGIELRLTTPVSRT